MKQKGYYINEETWGELARVSAAKAISISELIENYVLHGLSHEVELSGIERYTAKKRNIILGVDAILLTLNCVVNGTLQQKIDVLCALLAGISVASPLRGVKSIGELSLFEVLNDIKEWDYDLFSEIKRNMGKYRYIRNRYLALYPEKK